MNDRCPPSQPNDPACFGLGAVGDGDDGAALDDHLFAGFHRYGYLPQHRLLSVIAHRHPLVKLATPDSPLAICAGVRYNKGTINLCKEEPP